MATQKALPSLEDQFAKRVDAALDPQAQAIAASLGPAPGTDRYTQRERDALWDTRDESVDQEQLFQALQQGITPDGAKAVALFRMAPELAQAVVGTPVPPATAAAVAKLAEYPGRYVLTVGHSGDAEAQVAFVKEQHKRAAKRQQPPMADVQATPMAMPQEGY